MLERKPITIQRKSLSICGKGYKKHGGFVLFNKPNSNPPRIKVGSGQRVLWCPYCGEWTVFVTRAGDSGRMYCSLDGFTHTQDFYVSKVNKLMWEDIPVDKVKELAKYAMPRR